MRETTLSCFLDPLDYFLTDSGRLLPNATALVPELLSDRPPSKRLRLKFKLPRYGGTHEDNHQYLDELLEPMRELLEAVKSQKAPILVRLVDCSEAQLASSDPSLRSYSVEDTSSGHSILDPCAGGRGSLEIEAAVVTVEAVMSNVEGQSGDSAHSEAPRLLTSSWVHITLRTPYLRPPEYPRCEHRAYGGTINGLLSDACCSHDIVKFHFRPFLFVSILSRATVLASYPQTSSTCYRLQGL
jgi:hypothetical protein